MLTLHLEIKYIWLSRLTYTKVLYLLTRHLTLASTIDIDRRRMQNTLYSVLTTRIFNIRELGSRTTGNELNELHTDYNGHTIMFVEFQTQNQRSTSPMFERNCDRHEMPSLTGIEEPAAVL